jgi:hypothetical protein
MCTRVTCDFLFRAFLRCEVEVLALGAPLGIISYSGARARGSRLIMRGCLREIIVPAAT